ncbi:hypothetical protein NQ314_018566 [Rhamnusium bicolor]|uniref:DDE Tnp4 domain-containing protein n=1 Tax=Rhamnusium bicolor TaxID=1586634 RepID=A0AAV8WRM6_9CUCU|nr:hypothetical protein NQ314_018566 [Rhamnusium bicolor]
MLEAIKYLASGNTFTDLHYSYRLGISTISEIVHLVCQQIWQILKAEYLGQPSQEQWLNIAANFQGMSHFPHCIGALVGKHIRVQKFRHSGSMNLNYKHYFSIVLMAVANAAYKFVYVDIGAYGKDCDSSVFQQTVFWKKVKNGSLNIPDPAPLQQDLILPFVLVRDEAFALDENLLRPFGGQNLTVAKRMFNYRLTRARRFVECTFSILANKWRIFHRALNISKEFAKDIVKATVILHNFFRERDGLRPSDMYVGAHTQGLQDIPQGTGVRGGRHANDVRNKFSNYFMSPTGSLPWQMAKI